MDGLETKAILYVKKTVNNKDVFMTSLVASSKHQFFVDNFFLSKKITSTLPLHYLYFLFRNFCG